MHSLWKEASMHRWSKLHTVQNHVAVKTCWAPECHISGVTYPRGWQWRAQPAQALGWQSCTAPHSLIQHLYSSRRTDCQPYIEPKPERPLRNRYSYLPGTQPSHLSLCSQTVAYLANWASFFESINSWEDVFFNSEWA